MADAGGARARNFARAQQQQHVADDYGADEHEDSAAPHQTPDFDNALRMAHHAQRLKAMELGLEHFSSGIASFKADQRRMFRRQTIITLAVGGFCLFCTLLTGIIASAAHRVPAPMVVASVTPLSSPTPAPMPSYAPTPYAPQPATQAPAPSPTINSAQNNLIPVEIPTPIQQPVQQQPTFQQPQPQIQAQAPAPVAQPQAQEEPTLEMPKQPVALGRYSEIPASAVQPPQKQARKLSPFESSVTTRLASTGQLLPESWLPMFAHETAGDQRAKLQIAAKFLKGEGIKPDPTFAVTLIREAAKAGNKEAMMWLAYSYAAGNIAGKPDPVSAAHWFSEAAKAGVTGAYAELGKIYEKGVDGAPDPETALSWYQRAVQAGDKSVADSVQRLNRQLMSQNAMVPAPAPVQKPAAPMLQPAAASVPAPTRDPYLAVANRAQPVVATIPAPPISDDGNPNAATERSADIRAAQRMLKVLGYKIDKADGALGTQTQNAIRGYQRDHAAYPDGQFTPELLENLTRDIRFGQ